MGYRSFSTYGMPDAEPTIALARAQRFEMGRQTMGIGGAEWEALTEKGRQERAAFVRAQLTRVGEWLRSFWMRMPRPVQPRTVG